ncbi:hypothetical protein [Nocardia sp. NPDC052112]|uniref:hypothetical protein n=1 Tax=Nocardia sp. NPDC052112 TaxID=3155646 RepID=UPI0034382C92
MWGSGSQYISGRADDGRALTDALALGVNAVVVQVRRAAADLAALDAVCRSAAFADAALAIEVPAGPAWSDSEVRAQVGEMAVARERHGVRGELHAVDLRVLAAAAELAPDCRRVAMINSLTVATRGMRGAAGWVVRAVRLGADAIIAEVRRAGATGIAIRPHCSPGTSCGKPMRPAWVWPYRAHGASRTPARRGRRGWVPDTRGVLTLDATTGRAAESHAVVRVPGR